MCKLFQKQFSTFYSKLWPLKDALCEHFAHDAEAEK